MTKQANIKRTNESLRQDLNEWSKFGTSSSKIKQKILRKMQIKYEKNDNTSATPTIAAQT